MEGQINSKKNGSSEIGLLLENWFILHNYLWKRNQ